MYSRRRGLLALTSNAMDQERKFLAALQASTTLAVEGDQVTRSDADGVVQAVFVAAG
jgi:hypothetical protein